MYINRRWLCSQFRRGADTEYVSTGVCWDGTRLQLPDDSLEQLGRPHLPRTLCAATSKPRNELLVRWEFGTANERSCPRMLGRW